MKPLEVLEGLRVDRVGVDVGVRRQVDLGPDHVEERVGPALREARASSVSITS